MMTSAIAGLPVTPAALADEKVGGAAGRPQPSGASPARPEQRLHSSPCSAAEACILLQGNVVVVQRAADAGWVERMLRQLCAELGCSAGFAARPLTGALRAWQLDVHRQRRLLNEPCLVGNVTRKECAC